MVDRCYALLTYRHDDQCQSNKLHTCQALEVEAAVFVPAPKPVPSEDELKDSMAEKPLWSRILGILQTGRQ